MAEDIKLHTARLIIHTPWVEDAQDVFTLMKGYMAEVVESMKRYLFMQPNGRALCQFYVKNKLYD